MRAWQVEACGEPRDVLRLVDVEEPEPGPGQLRLRVLAAGVGLPDVHLCRGSYALTPPRPFTPGQELVGIVTACGEGARAREGERLLGVSGFQLRRGSLAESCLAADALVFPVPEAMPDVEAGGFFIAFHTAYVGLVRRGALRAGETLLVLGAAGGTGQAAVQLGAALGARVIATAGGPEKVAFCESLGADVVIDYRAHEIAAAVRDTTGGRGVQVVFDPVGGPAFDAATRCVAPEGRILAVGFGSGRWGQPSTPHLVSHDYSVVGVMPGRYGRAYAERAHAELLALWEAKRLRVAVHRAFPFEAAPAAVEEVAAGRARGRVVVSL